MADFIQFTWRFIIALLISLVLIVSGIVVFMVSDHLVGLVLTWVGTAFHLGLMFGMWASWRMHLDLKRGV